jgi:hypothetical protein
MGDEHAELCAPVAHVIEPQHVVPEELQHTAERVSDDRRPQVTLTELGICIRERKKEKGFEEVIIPT